MPPAATSGKRIGIIVGAVVAGLAVVGIGGYFGYRMLFANDSSGRVATSESTPATAPEPAPASEPPKDVAAAPPPAQASVSMQSTPTPPDAEAKPVTKDATSVGTDSTKAPGTVSSMKDSSKAPPAKASNPPGPPGSTPSTTDTANTVAQARNPAQQTAQPDRWQQMKEAMSRCVGETFFKRVACEQSVGLQYCEGYWGKVPQCPSGPPKDRGQ